MKETQVPNTNTHRGTHVGMKRANDTAAFLVRRRTDDLRHLLGTVHFHLGEIRARGQTVAPYSCGSQWVKEATRKVAKKETP